MNVLVICLLWLLLFNQVKWDWIVNPNYSFGWAVPILGVYLFWMRWQTRPQPKVTPSRSRATGLAMFVGGLALLLLPLRLIQEVNTDWRLAAWIFALTVVLLSWALIFWSGGVAWWRHFLFVSAFMLLAIPWPRAIETPLIQGMMSTVTFLVVEILNFAGIPALQIGNIVELTTGRVGVAEACSGIQSFQAALMVSLFLGEMFGMRLGKRVGLFCFSVFWAFFCNLLRTFFLSYMSYREGITAVDRWHDSSGNALMLLCFAGIIGVSLWMAPKPAPAEPSEPIQEASGIPRWVLLFLLIWVPTIELGALGWFRYHENRGVTQTQWEAVFPETHANYKAHEVTYDERTILRFNDGGKATWTETDGSFWSMFFFRWNQGNARASNNLKHSPEICLTAAGSELKTTHGVKVYSVHGLDIPFDVYTFLRQGRPVHVFYSIWMDKLPAGEKANLQMDWSLPGRIRRVMNGVRPSSQQVMEIAIAGMPNFDQAESAFLKVLPELIRPI